MPRNVYFSQAVKSEQDLYEDLIVESLKIYGQDAYYIPRTLVSRDVILNEDPSSKFDDAYLIETYIENVGCSASADTFVKKKYIRANIKNGPLNYLKSKTILACKEDETWDLNSGSAALLEITS